MGSSLARWAFVESDVPGRKFFHAFLRKTAHPFASLICMKSSLFLFVVALLAPVVASGQDGHPQRLPDPRYRAPFGVWELDRVASMVAKASGFAVRGKLRIADQQDCPLARIQGSASSGIVTIHPAAAREVPPNSWAFIFGHEFAHQTDSLARSSSGCSNQECERRADIVGAEYAVRGGFDVAAYAAWILSCPESVSQSHGSRHGRAMALIEYFRIPREEVEIHRQRLLRYSTSRS